LLISLSIHSTLAQVTAGDACPYVSSLFVRWLNDLRNFETTIPLGPGHGRQTRRGQTSIISCISTAWFLGPAPMRIRALTRHGLLASSRSGTVVALKPYSAWGNATSRPCIAVLFANPHVVLARTDDSVIKDSPLLRISLESLVMRQGLPWIAVRGLG